MTAIGFAGAFTVARDVRFRVVDGDAVVIVQSRGSVLQLNATGSRALELVSAGASLDDVVAAIATEFAADVDEVDADVRALFARLVDAGVLDRTGVADRGEAASAATQRGADGAGFHDVVKRAWRQNTLLVALLELGYECNLDCTFCYNDRALAGRRLQLPDWLRVLDELQALNTLNVVLSGGEPMVHKDFFAIGRGARERGFVVRLKTNGHLLRGDVLARVQREIDPFVVEVSLHGASAAVHDRQTQVAGSFARLVENLAEMKAAGLRVKINSTLTSWNEDELEGMFAIADRFSFPLAVDPDVTPRDDGDQSPMALAATDAGLRRMMEVELARHAPSTTAATATGAVHSRHADADCAVDGEKHCGAGSSTLCIDPYGNVYPCVQWRRRVGNVHDAPLADLWRGAPGLTEVRALGVDVKRMVESHGARGAQMAFCPGTAESRGGHALEPYATATRRADAALVVGGRLRVIG